MNGGACRGEHQTGIVALGIVVARAAEEATLTQHRLGFEEGTLAQHSVQPHIAEQRQSIV